ncbi:division/cell wall cluster transcriptional repressor MraZ [Novosphingopyxis sp.]|uniref:division/cell wall cluster transcriptional repressor MraZ n=1 Tax=Novosphingopyxis sp. TaxID=2709690 RepID=UPI003B5B7C09
MAGSFVYGGSGLSTIDGKGRCTIPSELRSTVEISSNGNVVCLARHPDLPCLMGFGTAERDRLATDLDKQWDYAQQRGEQFDRQVAGGPIASSLMEIGFEASGRFVMPPMLRHFGKLEGQAFFHGNITNFYIWNPSILLRQEADFEMQKEIAEYFLAEAERKRK